MRALLINEVCGHGSTGKICTEIADEYDKKGWEVKIAYGRDRYVPECYKKYAVRIASFIDVREAALEARLLDNAGFSNRHNTKKFVKWAEDYKPDLIWLHNLHGYYINIDILFIWLKDYIKRNKSANRHIEILWTLHDCWSFTGHCSHFTAIKCNKWQDHCTRCPQKTDYPTSLFWDKSYHNYEKKKLAFTNVPGMKLISPSQWLADLVKKSFLKEYPIQVIHNKIDTNIFKPTPSNFREKYGLEDKFIVLGVAGMWSERKGLYDFYKLAQMLDNSYAIVLVGLTQKQIRDLPKKIRGIARLNNQKELASLYSAADVVVNPSVEETYGMTQVEAKACGTPSIVYKGTACEEVAHEIGNIAVDQNPEAIKKALYKMGGGQ